MSHIRVLSAGEDLLQCVLGKLPADPAELSRTLCVFSGKRPAFFLRKALAERLGRSFLPVEHDHGIACRHDVPR